MLRTLILRVQNRFATSWQFLKDSGYGLSFGIQASMLMPRCVRGMLRLD